jgi:hydrogenase expression/formation protein HypC
MCLAVPMEVIKINGGRGMCMHGGVSREVDLRMVPRIRVGDYAVVHAGFAIQVIDRAEAERTLAILKEAGI